MCKHSETFGVGNARKYFVMCRVKLCRGGLKKHVSLFFLARERGKVGPDLGCLAGASGEREIMENVRSSCSNRVHFIKAARNEESYFSLFVLVLNFLVARPCVAGWF